MTNEQIIENLEEIKEAMLSFMDEKPTSDIYVQTIEEAIELIKSAYII